MKQHPHLYKEENDSFSDFLEELNDFANTHEKQLKKFNIGLDDYVKIASLYDAFNNYNFRRNTMSILYKIDMEIISPEMYFDNDNTGEKKKLYTTVKDIASDMSDIKEILDRLDSQNK